MGIFSLQSGDGRALYSSNTLFTMAGNSKTDGALGELLLSGSDQTAMLTRLPRVTLRKWASTRITRCERPSGHARAGQHALGRNRADRDRHGDEKVAGKG